MMNHARKNFKRWDEAVAWLREQPDQQSLVQECYYDDPLIDAAERYRQSVEWQSVAHLLNGRSGSALDVGAGRGVASYSLAHEGFNVVALEPDSSDLVGTGAIRKLAAETGLNIRTLSELSEHITLSDGQFDVIFARAVLHHMQDLNAGCRELARVLKPGGLLLAIREHVISKPGDLPAFLQSHPLHHLYGGENAYMLGQYRGALQAAGLRIVKQVAPLDSPLNYYPQTPETLCSELQSRLVAVPGVGPVLAPLLRYGPVFSLALKLAGWVDNRPGRLYSFICDKPS